MPDAAAGLADAPVDPHERDDSAPVEVEGFGHILVRHKRFAEGVHAHGNLTRAYRDAGYECTDKSASEAASRLSRHVKVRRYLLWLGKDRLMGAEQIRAGLELEAMTGEHAGARVRAYELCGKAQGMFADDLNISVNRTSDADLVKALVGDDQALAAELLKKLRGE